MNEIVSLPKLVAMLSSLAGVSGNAARKFITEFTSIITEAIANGEPVQVRGIGTFQRTNDKRLVVFTPDPTLAEAINGPFAAFDTVDISDNVTDEMLDSSHFQAPPTPQQPAQQQTVAQQQPVTPQPVQQPYTPQPVAPQQPTQQQVEIRQTVQRPYVPTQTEQQPESVQVTPPPIQDEPQDEPIIIPMPRKKTFNRDEFIRQNNPKPVEQPVERRETPRQRPEINRPEQRAQAQYNYHSYDSEGKGKTLAVIFAGILGLIIGIAIGFFVHDPISSWMLGTDKYAIDSSSADTDNALDPLLPEAVDDTDDTSAKTFSDNLSEEDAALAPTPAAPAAATSDAQRQAELLAEQQRREDEARIRQEAQEKARRDIEERARRDAEQQQPKPAAQAPVAPARNSVPLEVDDVYETTRAGRYLATMAKEYYGNEHYWVYIYKENASKLGNPDKLPGGVKLHIPPFSKYATSPNDLDTNLAEAKNEGVKIKAQYSQR